MRRDGRHTDWSEATPGIGQVASHWGIETTNIVENERDTVDTKL